MQSREIYFHERHVSFWNIKRCSESALTLMVRTLESVCMCNIIVFRSTPIWKKAMNGIRSETDIRLMSHYCTRETNKVNYIYNQSRLKYKEKHRYIETYNTLSPQIKGSQEWPHTDTASSFSSLSLPIRQSKQKGPPTQIAVGAYLVLLTEKSLHHLT